MTRRSRNLAGGAAAVLLAVAVVGLYLATNRAHPTASGPVTPGFGKLPPPILNPPLGIGGVADSTALAIPYFGPATLSWSGQPPKATGTARVERVILPTPAELDVFARGVGGTLTSAWATARVYQLPGGFDMVINHDNPVGVEPNFVITRLTAVTPAATPVSTDAARAAADAFLRTRGLTPTWDNAVMVTRYSSLSATVFFVLYQREVLVGSSRVPEVDRSGSPQGILVEVESGGQVVGADGVVRLAAQSATYGLRPPASAVPDALVASPAMAPDQFPSLSPFPKVALTNERLVYIAVAAGSGTTYLEPAYFFTGTFTQGGTDFEKRILIPALVASAIES